MKRGGSQRYPKDMIRSAVERLERGEGLTAVGKSFGVPKNTVKYWSDNAAKFLTEGSGKSASAMQTRVANVRWNLLMKTYRKIGNLLDEAPLKELIDLLGKLQSDLPLLTVASPGGKVPSRVVEMREETRLTVREFLAKKKDEAPSVVVEMERVQAARPTEPLPSVSPEPSGSSPGTDVRGGKNANERVAE